MRASSLKRLLRDSVSVTTHAGVDAYGQPQTATSVTVSGRVMHQQKRSVDADGEDFTTTTQVMTTHDIYVGDLLTVDGESRPVRAIKRADSLRAGVTLTEAQL